MKTLCTCPSGLAFALLFSVGVLELGLDALIEKPVLVYLQVLNSLVLVKVLSLSLLHAF